jgi:hypothetical protein
MQFANSECWGDKPQEIEVTPTCVFVREDFTAVEQMEDGQPTGVTGWTYREARMGYGEYSAYASAQARENEAMLESAIVELAELIGGE